MYMQRYGWKCLVLARIGDALDLEGRASCARLRHRRTPLVVVFSWTNSKDGHTTHAQPVSTSFCEHGGETERTKGSEGRAPAEISPLSLASVPWDINFSLGIRTRAVFAAFDVLGLLIVLGSWQWYALCV